MSEELKTCATCQWWSDEDPFDGKAEERFCIHKDLYTHTDPTYECDEYDFRGECYYTEKKE